MIDIITIRLTNGKRNGDALGALLSARPTGVKMHRRTTKYRALRDILGKPNDHLLRDIGVDRSDIVDLTREFWLEWDRRQLIWRL